MGFMTMNPALEKLAILLAASGLSDKAIRESLKEVEYIGAETLVSMIQDIRHTLDARRWDLFSVDRNLGRDDALERERDQIADQVIRLLLGEAHLSASVAAKRIGEALTDAQKYTQDIPPFKPKQGFRNWIRRLPDIVTPSELLHYATRIRNAEVHVPTDWPLRDRK
jgi:hypothetical protein